MAEGSGNRYSQKKHVVEMNQFGPISLLNVRWKIFFSVVARRLTSYLVKNNLIESPASLGALSTPVCMI